MASKMWRGLVLATIAGLIIWQLCVFPLVGLASNGDFDRVMGSLGLMPDTPQRYDRLYFDYFVNQYRFTEPYWASGYWSSQIGMIWLAMEASRFVNASLFDLRLLAVMNTTMLLVGVWWILYGTKGIGKVPAVALGIAIVLIVPDVAYVAAFSSLYTQAATYYGLMMLIGAFCFVATERRWLVIYWLAAAIFLYSKPAETVLVLVIAPVGIALTFAVSKRNWEKALAVFFAIILVLGSAVYYNLTPVHMTRAGKFFAVFDAMLDHSPTPDEDMVALILPKEWRPCIGKNPYRLAGDESCTDAVVDALNEKLSYSDVLGFYVSRPSRLYALVHHASQYTFETRPGSLGNYEYPRGPKEKSYGYAFWSSAKAGLPGWLGLPLVIVLLGVNGVGGFALLLKTRWGSEYSLLGLGLLSLSGIAAGAYLIPILAESGSDIVRHHYSFQILADALLTINVVMLVKLVAQRRKPE